MAWENILRAALEYAANGYKVFPVSGKIPCTPRGHLDATENEQGVIELWEKYPGSGVAISCEGLIVLDVDGRENAWYKSLSEEQLASLDLAPCQQTQHGGMHLFFRRPKVCNVHPSVGTVGPKIDIRTNGSYVVAAPSPGYQWFPEYQLDCDRAELGTPPMWLLVAAGDRIPKEFCATIREGERNATLTKVAGHFRRQGLDEAGILEKLREHNKACTKPLEEKELASIARSVSRYPSPVPSRGDILTWEQVSKMDIPPPRWLVQDLILEKGLHVIGGPPGSYKSFLTIAAVMHAATGKSLSERHQTLAQTRTLYLGAEGGDQLLRRFQLLERGHNLKPNDQLMILPRPILLDDPETREGFQELVLDLRIQCLVLDPLRELAGLREDCQEGWQAYVRWLRDMANKMAILVIHHTRKLPPGQKREASLDALSGPGFLASSCDLGFLAFRHEDDKPGFRLCPVKARDVEAIPTSDFILQKTHSGLHIQLESKTIR